MSANLPSLESTTPDGDPAGGGSRATGASRLWNLVRRAGVVVVGAVLTIAGVAMLVLPGPGILSIVGGLSLLATEFRWARRLLQLVQRRIRTTAESAGRRWPRRRAPR
jgi:uncharacterized protein (TIGR02611 family)